MAKAKKPLIKKVAPPKKAEPLKAAPTALTPKLKVMVSSSVYHLFNEIHQVCGLLEISNTGSLPPELSVGDLRKNHSSYPRNPDIAHIFFLRGYIDKIGRGTLKIIESCRLAGLREPKWKSEESIVRLTFYTNIKPSKSEEASKGVSGGVTAGVSKELARRVEGVIEGVTEGVTEGVKERMSAIVALLSKQQGLRISHMALDLNVPDKSLERYIKQLKEAKIIEFKGAPKSGGYYLTTNAVKKLKL